MEVKPIEEIDEILTREIEIRTFGVSLIGVEEQEDRAIENGADEEILFYVPYEEFQKSNEEIKAFVEEELKDDIKDYERSAQ